MSELSLAFGLGFTELYETEGLARVDAAFLDRLGAADADLRARLDAARAAPESLDAKESAALIVDLAPRLEAFVAELFGIEREAEALAERHGALADLYRCKRLFVQRRAVKAARGAEVEAFDGPALEAALEAAFGEPVTERAFARHVMAWLDDEAVNADNLETAKKFAAWATLSAAGRARFGGGILFKVPRKTVPEALIETATTTRGGIEALCLPPERQRPRDGFGLTDPGADLAGALDQAGYCIFCHKQGKDSCARGLRARDGGFRESPFGVLLAGCPLEERVSEMNLLKSEGRGIAALAAACIDNPMLAATGHRICNDCMKACIYQRQEPVDIPQVETRVLKDVLALPWGFEIYGLLTRWNQIGRAHV